MTTNRTVLAATLAVAAAITLAACSSDTSSGMNGMGGENGSGMSSSSMATSDVNQEDLMFAVMMKPHHEQAVEMADMILAKDGISADVTGLATQIKAAQVPEIAQLEEWITAWGGTGSMSGMDHSMNGMMSDDDMSTLESATGSVAEKLFLEQMIVHHEGAIEMAQTEIDGGQNADVIEMANAIVTSQTDEIATMRDLLSGR